MDQDSGTTDSSDFELVTFSTCAEFLALNLSKDEVEIPGSSFLNNSCGRQSVNVTAIQLHPARYAVLVTYPIFLLICTVGNLLTLIVLGRETTKSVKRIYLMSLACSDFCFMWSQFFPYLSNYATITSNPGAKLFLDRISGSCTFFQEMLITSSDWILVAFSIERFFAVVFPLYYNIFVSKRRATAVVLVVFLLAGLYAMYNLFDYYWFLANDEPRCPAALIRPPTYLIRWHAVYEWSVLIVPVITFLVILSVNLAVSIQLLKHQKFRRANTLGRNHPDSVTKDHQAIHMLLACAVLYILTQFPAFVYNILQILQHYPFCSLTFTDNFVANYTRAIGVTVNINYSANFLLYYGVSTTFRQGLRDFKHAVIVASGCSRNPALTHKPILGPHASTKTNYYTGFMTNGAEDIYGRHGEEKKRNPRFSLESVDTSTTSMGSSNNPRY
ncbi:hypothetical protein BV898_02426 [Hypsibius exemplaris]|uniref:G-protein coupled receptors family 1 profile domain-containing protein n=1 Tax=Hypsibius exemplaris TaxID=2072580 RepID=A0A1W0X8F9_HYPEX|nr:hypothetical protein BV898_02426 [Hypsibius exemplaris]